MFSWIIVKNMTLKYDLFFKCYRSGPKINFDRCSAGNSNLDALPLQKLEVHKAGFHDASCWLAPYQSENLNTHNTLLTINSVVITSTCS